MKADSKTDKVAENLNALREVYAAKLEGEFRQLQKLGNTLRNASEAEAESLLTQLHQRLHSMAGSAGTFGFKELGSKARELEIEINGWLETSSINSKPWQEGFIEQLFNLRLAETECNPAEQTELVHAQKHDSDNSYIYIIDTDIAVSKELAQELRHFGYRVKLFSNLDTAETAILQERPSALIVDSEFSGDSLDGVRFVQNLQARLNNPLPVFFLSTQDDFSSRLAVARTGALGFYLKPLDTPKLVDRMEQLFNKRDEEPHRILIVDDDEILAAHFHMVLETAGMKAITVTEPQKVLETVHALRPELILMDVHMPECSGPELARVIRQRDEWITMPIVYLSAETDLDKQIKALNKGGDDFLTKPISDRQLVVAIQARVSRARRLNELMSRDSLTGLLKHSTIKDQLNNEFSRAARTGKSMCAAMLDIDHFKKINDTYGHAMGDQVIKALAHLLTQRFRRSDSIGRYGGEEFVVVLPECEADSAIKVVDAIRVSFKAIRFVSEGKEFSVTLSAGLACSLDFTDPAMLLEAADESLYAAKHGGRDQTCLASPDKDKPSTKPTGI